MSTFVLKRSSDHGFEYLATDPRYSAPCYGRTLKGAQRFVSREDACRAIGAHPTRPYALRVVRVNPGPKECEIAFLRTALAWSANHPRIPGQTHAKHARDALRLRSTSAPPGSK